MVAALNCKRMQLHARGRSARLRNRAVLQDIEDRGEGRVLVTLSNTIEIEGEAKPALVAESLALLMSAPRVDTRG
jgi:hypothetical protein